MHNFRIRFRIHDLLFYLLLVISFYYTRNMLCRLMMVVFFGYTFLQMLVSKSKMPVPFYYIGFLLFVLYGAANIVLGNVINAGVARTMVVSLTLNLMMIFAIAQYIYMTNNLSRVLRVAEVGILSTALVVVLLSVKTITKGRLGGGTEMNANMLALLSVYGFVLSMYLRKNGNISRYAYWFRLAFYITVLLLTGSRKGLLMIVVANMVLQFAMKPKKIVRNIVVCIGMAAVLYFLIMNVGVLYNIVGVRVENLLLMLTEGTATESSLESRQELIKLGMEYIEEKPWTGYGFDCYKMISGKNAGGKVGAGEVGFYSHNNYIELLFGGGIIGFVLYYLPVLYLLKKLLKGLNKNSCMPYLLAILIAKLAMEFAYVSYYERVDAYIMAILLGCALSAWRGGTKTQDQLVQTT